MANIIKIKRSSSTAAPPSLNEGELAVSFLSGKLFVGNSSAVIPIAGIQNPGVLTANQALVANATSGIDKIIVSNAVITSVWANGASGTAGQALTSNSTGGVYWADPVTAVSSLTDVTLSGLANNDILVYDATAGKWENHTISGNVGQVNATFVSQNLQLSLEPTVNVATALNVGANVNLSTSAINVGNSTVNAVVNSTALSVGTTVVNTAAVTLGSNVSITTSTLSIGNSTVNTVANSSTIQIGTVVVNSTVVQVGSNVYANSSALFVGNSTVNTQIYAGNVRLNGSELFIGNSTSNVIITGSSASFPNTTITGFANVYTTLQVGANVTVQNDTLSVGNSTVNTTVNSTSVATSLFTAGNTTVNGFANVIGNFTAHANVQLGNSFGVDVVSFVATVNTEITPSANNTQKLGRADLRWGEVNSNNVLATNTVTVELTVNGNTKLGDATSDVVSVVATVNTNIIPTANLTYSLGNNTLYWAEVHAGNVHADYGYFQHDVAVYGDLTITGNLVTSNVQSVVISDPLIYLAGNNYTSDLVDIGFVGNYHQGGTDKHTGLFRDASVDQYYLFKGLTQELDNVLTVNTADPTFALADLNAWLLSGALVSNSLAVTITANSTVNVNITANSLSLSTALAVGSGGTGLNTVTTNGILYGNTTGPLGVTAAGTEGKVFQAGVGGVPLFADLDGGTF